MTPEPGILAVAGACLGRALVGDTQLCSSDSLPVMSPESWRTPCRLTPATVSCLKHKCAHVSSGQRDIRGTAVGSRAGASVLRCPGAHKRNRELAEEASGARASRGPLSGTKGASGQLLVPWRQPSNPDQAHWGSCTTGQPHATKAACTPAEPAKEPTRSPAHVWANPTRYTEADRNSIGLGTRNPPSFLEPVTRCALPGPQPIAPHGSPSPPRDCAVVRSVRDI